MGPLIYGPGNTSREDSRVVAGARRDLRCGIGIYSAVKSNWSHTMHTTKIVLAASVLWATLMPSGASAQGVNVSGPWQCVALCFGPPGGIAFITQYGRDLNVLAGVPSRAWIDYPGHIWFEIGHQGAIYSPDGLTLQFDSGTVWQRAPEVPPPPPLFRSPE